MWLVLEDWRTSPFTRHSSLRLLGSGTWSAVTRSALAPGRRGEARLARGQVFRPHDHLAAVLPLRHDHLVADLEPIGIDLVVAEGRAHLKLEQHVAEPVGIERARPAHGLGEDQAASVHRGRVIDRLAPAPL